MTKLIMLGTGNATVTKCYNTCYAFEREGRYFMVDAGGGNGILAQLERAGIELGDIEGLYVTHGHTDHLLGVIWMVRVVATQIHNGKRTAPFLIYGHEKVLGMLRIFCDLCIQPKFKAHIDQEIQLVVVEDGGQFQALGMGFTAFDIESTKEKQFGYQAILPDGQVLACTGDEPYNPHNEVYVRGADWLLTEAFCLYEDRGRFKPYEKHHSTVKDAAALAEQLGIKHLLLYHTEDKTLETRKQRYSAEARAEFSGIVYVPEDLEEIQL